MASLVARAAVAAAALPSDRARRLGSGRLSLAALPGHGAAVLAGRRVGTGRGGVLAVVLKGASQVVGAGGSGSLDGGEGDEVPDEQQSRLITQVEEVQRLYGPWMFFNSGPEYLTEKQKICQRSLREIGERSYNLVKNVANRLDPEPGTPLFKRLLEVAFLCWGAAETDAYATVSIMRRAVSEAHQASLPRNVPYPDPADQDSTKSIDEELVAIVRFVYRSVKADIDHMIGRVD